MNSRKGKPEGQVHAQVSYGELSQLQWKLEYILVQELGLLLLFKSQNSVQLFVTPWTVACQAPLFMGFPIQEYWSGLPFPSAGDLPYPEIKLASLEFPDLAGEFFTTNATWETQSQ